MSRMGELALDHHEDEICEPGCAYCDPTEGSQTPLNVPTSLATSEDGES
jgi:hypothetical protein